jgi:hypothetical protein
MEQNLIYYIDQYLDEQFMSRSEPYLDRVTCEEAFNDLCNNSCENMYYRINVSMPIKEYETLVLSSQKIRIRFVDREVNPLPESKTESEIITTDSKDNWEVSSIDSSPKLMKAFRSHRGFFIYNNKKTRSLLVEQSWTDYFEATIHKKLLFISNRTLTNNNIDFFNYFRDVKMSQKISNLLSM